ncbi:MAG: LAGLIDADG family homing endonuclease, partial [Candidatus Micrarchaeota archaeon]
MTSGWTVLPEFRVVQHRRDEQVLIRIRDYFGFGKVTVNNGDRFEFRVRGIKNLLKLIDFFRLHPL